MPDLNFTDTLLHAAAEYCTRTGMSRSRLATIVVNDGKFFDRIERGGGFTTKTYQRFLDFFRENEHGRPKRRKAA